MRRLLGALVLILAAAGQVRGDGGESVSGDLGAGLRVFDPVPLEGPVPAVLRSVPMGDQVLLQVRYESRPVAPKSVTAKVGSRAMTALQVVTSGSRLFDLSAGESATGEAGSHFAVLLRANSPGSCTVKVAVTMSDGTQRSLAFAFTIIATNGANADSTPRSKEAPCIGKYSAQQVPGQVLIFATGAHATSGYEVLFEELPIDVYPPEFRLVHRKPEGVVAQVLTPFQVFASFRATKKIDVVYVQDARGRHAVKVEQVPELAH